MSINRDNFEERLFKASEEHAYPFQENDWDVLEGLLEKKKKRRAFVFWLNGLGLFLVASCFAAYFAVQSYHQQEAEELCAAEEIELAQQINSSKVNNDLDSVRNNTSEYIHNTHQTYAVLANAEQENDNIIKSALLATAQNQTKKFNSFKPSNENGSVKSGLIQTKNPDHEEGLPQSDVGIPTPEALKEEERLNAKREEIEKKINEERKEEVKLAIADSLLLKKDSLLVQSNSDTNKIVAESKEEKKQKDSTKYSRFSALFAVAPDLSFTQLVDVSKLQLSAFVGGEINITRNFSTLVGVAYSNKSYVARGSDYTPGKPKFWTGGVKPREVSGSCSILDMSLSLRYYHAFNDKGKTKFFAEVGSSSYLMMKEHYDFTYTNPNPSLVQQWNVQSGIIYSFSVLNFGLGMERKLNKHLSIQANPKFQMPLSALGWGSVKFSSAGLNMALKYSF
jgi:hypothetical protein